METPNFDLIRKIEVSFINNDGTSSPVGLLYIDYDNNKTTFSYFENYVTRSKFAIDPENLSTKDLMPLGRRDEKGKPRRFVIKDSNGEFNHLLGLLEPNEKSNKKLNLHGVFIDTMPGKWGLNLLRQQHPETKKFNDAMMFSWLGNRDFGKLRFTALDERVLEKSYIRGIDELDEARKNSVLMYLKELKAIPKFADYEYAYTVNGGSRPKVAFIDDLEDEYVAKFDLSYDDFDGISKVEHALAIAARMAEIDMSKTRLVELPSGKHALLSKRFDISDAGYQYHKVSMRTLLSAHSSSEHSDYVDMANILKKHSFKPDADVVELYRRMVFNLCCNNTDDHVSNFEMMLLPDDGWCLTPCFDIVLDPSSSPHATTMAGFNSSKLNSAFLERTANAFGIDINLAHEVANNVVSAISELPNIMQNLPVEKSVLSGDRHVLEHGLSNYWDVSSGSILKVLSKEIDFKLDYEHADHHNQGLNR